MSCNVPLKAIRNRASEFVQPGWRLRERFDQTANADLNARPVLIDQSLPHACAELARWVSGVSDRTERAYEKRATGFISKLGISELTPTNSVRFGRYVQLRCEKVGLVSVRQYRSAAAYFVARRIVDAEDGSEAWLRYLVAYIVIDAVQDAEGGEAGSRSMQKKAGPRSANTQRGKAKKATRRRMKGPLFPDADLATIAEALAKSRSPRAPALAAHLRVLRWTGGRPIEAATVSVLEDPDTLDEACSAGATVVIGNAKHREEGARACGPERFHHWSGEDWITFRDEFCKALGVVRACRARFDAAGWEDELGLMQRLLKSTCRRLGLQAYEMYDLRRQFAADAKADFTEQGYSREDARVRLAALMGHVSADTAHHHYPRANRAWGGRLLLPEPDERNVALVRNGERELPKKLSGNAEAVQIAGRSVPKR